MLSKSLRFSIVLAIMLAIFAGTALADRRGHHAHHPGKWDRGHDRHYENKWDNHHRGYRHGRYVHAHRSRHTQVVARRPAYHPRHETAYKTHPLAPRVLFLGPIPVPVPPPPHEVLNYLAGH